MKILIVIGCLVLATQYPPVKAFINDQIQQYNDKLDSQKQNTQQEQDAIKTQYMKQAE